VIKRVLAVFLVGAAAFATLAMGSAASASTGSPARTGAGPAVTKLTTFDMFCPYKLRSGVHSINIRTGPSTSYPVVDWWVEPAVKLIGEPPHRAGSGNNWREIYTGRWVYEPYIIATGGPCAA